MYQHCEISCDYIFDINNITLHKASFHRNVVSLSYLFKSIRRIFSVTVLVYLHVTPTLTKLV